MKHEDLLKVIERLRLRTSEEQIGVMAGVARAFSSLVDELERPQFSRERFLDAIRQAAGDDPQAGSTEVALLRLIVLATSTDPDLQLDDLREPPP